VNDVPIAVFQRAIRATHGAYAELVVRVSIVEDYEGERVWQGEVLVFEEPATGRRFYAWEVDGRVTAVLHEGPVDGPQSAVRAAILAGEEPARG
jgi:hypothetical protein